MGSTPPPYIGPNIATELILNSRLKNIFSLIHLDTSDRRELAKIGAIDFQNILYHLVKESADEPGTQNKIFQTVCNIGKQSIKKLLAEKEKVDVKNSLKQLSKEFKKSQVDFFSDELLDREAADLAYKGVKEFTLGNHNKALVKINEAISLDLYRKRKGRRDNNGCL